MTPSAAKLPDVSPDTIREQLIRILASPLFQGAERSTRLLRFLVEETVQGETTRLKEYTIGAQALGRGDSFDPRMDPVVRAEASRLRTRLEKYYSTEGRADPLVITLPKGSYVPQFHTRSVAPCEVADGDIGRPSPRRRAVWFAVGAAVAACAFAVAIWGWQHSTPPTEQLAYRFEVELRSNGELGSVVGIDAIISPDGTRVVFVSRGPDGVSKLNTRALDQSQVTELPGTEGARGPFFSPDGRWVGFWASGQLKKISIDGGLPVILCDSPDLLGASWGEDDIIIAALTRGRLWRVASSGGSPTLVIDLTGESAAPMWPQVLPGANLLLFTAIGPLGANSGNIEVLSMSDGKRKILVRGGTFGRFVNGHLFYVNQGTLFAIAFDPDRMETSGAASPVLNDVSYAPTFGYAQVDFSRTGTLVYRRDEAGGQLIAEWLDGSGKAEPLPLKPGNYGWPRVSPDGQRLALTAVESGKTSILLYDIRTNQISRSSSAAADYSFPIWAPEGRRLIVGGARGLAWLSADDLQTPQPLAQNGTVQVPWSFAPDGSRLAYYEMSAATAFDIWTIPIQMGGSGPTAGTPESVLRSGSFEIYPSFSPDGRWLVYNSNESGTFEVYVRALTNNGTKVRISDAGGTIAIWSPNGRELFYRSLDHRIMVAAYDVNDGAFVASKPRVWSDKRLGDTGVLPNFDLSPDGKRILALMPAAKLEDRQAQNHVTFVLNFFDDVRRRVASTAK